MTRRRPVAGPAEIAAVERVLIEGLDRFGEHLLGRSSWMRRAGVRADAERLAAEMARQALSAAAQARQGGPT